MPAVPTAERLRELLAYDPATGEFRWRVSRTRVRAGDIAGCPRYCRDSGYYIMIRVDGRMCCAHQLAWLYMTGEWPSAEIDHKNRVKHDNSWDNLRRATRAQNSVNMPARNASGYKGVRWRARERKWNAQISVSGKTRSLGYYDSAEAASAAYRDEAIRIYGEFAA